MMPFDPVKQLGAVGEAEAADEGTTTDTGAEPSTGAAPSTGGKQSFMDSTDPVRAYVKALQQFIGAPQTQVWDPPTHTQWWAWWRDNSAPLQSIPAADVVAPAYGTEPDRVATASVRPLLEAKDAALFALYAPLLALLHVPNTSREVYVAFMDENVAKVDTAMGLIQDNVRAAEVAMLPSGPVPGEELAAPRSYGWVWWGIGAVAIVVTAVLWPRKKE